MTYLSAKKIYPGNWSEALNGWYKNIDSINQDGTNNSSKAIYFCAGFRLPLFPTAWLCQSHRNFR